MPVGFRLFIVEREELVFKDVTGSRDKSLPSCLHHTPVHAEDLTKNPGFSDISRGKFYLRS